MPVPHGRVEPHGHAADGVDQLLEADEVDLHVVVDRDVEVVLDGVDERLGAVGVRGVDARGLAGAGDREVEVAREREDVGLLRLGIDPQHHDRVGAVAAGVAEEAAGVGVGGVDALAAVGAHQQVVGGLAAAGGQVDVVDPGDLPEPDAEVGRHRCRPEADDDDEAARDEQQPLRPGARAASGGGRHGRTTVSAGASSSTVIPRRHASSSAPPAALDRVETMTVTEEAGDVAGRPVRDVGGQQGALDAPVEGALRRGHHLRALHGLRRLRDRLPARRHRLRARTGRLQAVPPRGGARPRRLHPRPEGLHVLHPGLPPLPHLGARGRRAPLRPPSAGPTSRRASTRTSSSPGPATTWSTRSARTAGSCRRCSSGRSTTATSTPRSSRTSRARDGASSWKAIPGVATNKEEILAGAGSRYTYSANTLAIRRGARARASASSRWSA